MRVRVALADDSFLVREAIAELLRQDGDLDLVAVCRDGDELRDALRAHDVDVVVTDLRMPPSMLDEGVRIAAELGRSAPHVGVVLLSAYCEPTLAIELLATAPKGRGYLLKEGVHSRRQLTATVKAVAGGASAIDPKVMASLVEARDEDETSVLSGLTAPERDILGAMARGASNVAIAGDLGLSKRGVEKHISHIFAKLSLSSTPEVSRRVTAVLTYLAARERAQGGRVRTLRAAEPRRSRPGTAASP